MAEKLFLKERVCKAALHPFPFLEKLIETYELNRVDFKVVELILHLKELQLESVAAFIYHLSLSVRNGHLLVKVENHDILPSIESIWKKEADFKEQELKQLEGLVKEGFNELQNNPLFSPLFSDEKEHFPTKYLCKSQNKFYFQRYFKFETEILTHLKRIKESEPFLKINQETLSLEVNQLLQNKMLLKEQGEAILKAANQGLTFISGGPGTGKTYTAGYLIRLLLENLPEEERKNIKVSLAAPTGKAAANLESSLSKFIEGLSDLGFNALKAKTLHQLLSIKEGGRESQDSVKTVIKPLVADIILVDESSMIDVVLMAKLLAAIKKGARIIFLGDADQLPSVDAGSLFFDLIRLLPEHLVSLNVCLRAELEELVYFGKAINEGKSELVLEMLKKGVAVQQNSALTEESLLRYGETHFPCSFEEGVTPLEIITAFNHFRILSPLRKGNFGVDYLNRLFFHHLIKKQSSLEKKSIKWVPIILLRNDVTLDLYNGQVAVLVVHGSVEAKELIEELSVNSSDYALFADKKNGYRKVEALLLPHYEYAYCLSVHKAQGSEFDHVLCLLPEGSEYFGKEVLYTAVTRAKKKLEIGGTDEQLVKTLQNKGSRLSGISERWSGHVEKSPEYQGDKLENSGI